MGSTFLSLILWFVALGGVIYTFSYGYWLWQQKNMRGAISVALLALVTIIYSTFLIFYIT